MLQKFPALLALGLALSACVAPEPAVLPAPVPTITPAPGPVVSRREAATNFLAVVGQVEPVAESYCRQLSPGGNCDFRIVIDDRPGQPANAFQSVDASGRPLLAFTVALIADARNRDELAFVLGHEAAHHIAGHLPQVQSTAMAGALLAGILAQASGAGAQGVQAAQEMGAVVGARSYSKEFELEADALGAEIAFMAGYDPMRGAAYFDRLPDPGDVFLGSHPANSRRKQVVAATVARLGG